MDSPPATPVYAQPILPFKCIFYIMREKSYLAVWINREDATVCSMGRRVVNVGYIYNKIYKILECEDVLPSGQTYSTEYN